MTSLVKTKATSSNPNESNDDKKKIVGHIPDALANGLHEALIQDYNSSIEHGGTRSFLNRLWKPT